MVSQWQRECAARGEAAFSSKEPSEVEALQAKVAEHEHFWKTREEQQKRQGQLGKIDAGARGAVTGGAQMAALEQLVVDILKQAGLNQLDIRTMNLRTVLPAVTRRTQLHSTRRSKPFAHRITFHLAGLVMTARLRADSTREAWRYKSN
jgi:hypothetical protein